MILKRYKQPAGYGHAVSYTLLPSTLRQFRYLGSSFQENEMIDGDVTYRIKIGWLKMTNATTYRINIGWLKRRNATNIKSESNG